MTTSSNMTYLFALEQIPDGAVQPGASIAVWWLPVACPRAASQDQEAPAAVEVSIALYGPYPTQNEAEQARAAIPAYPAKPSATPAATNTPFGLSDTTGGRESETLALPATLQTGFYVVLAQTYRPIDNAWCRSSFVVRAGA
jgi:hypothetical protein